MWLFRLPGGETPGQRVTDSSPRMTLRLELRPFEETPSPPTRPVTSEDLEGLADLMFESYQGTVDYDGESRDEAVAEVRRTLDGDYGSLVFPTSLVIEKDERLASATLVTLHGKPLRPFLAFSMTHPDEKRKGLAAGLLRQTVNRLLEEGYEELSLVVTRSNRPAVRLYEGLGFRPTESDS